jgi:hypothetical protein
MSDVLWFVFPVVIIRTHRRWKNLEDLQEQDFEQFEQQGK